MEMIKEIKRRRGVEGKEGWQGRSEVSKEEG